TWGACKDRNYTSHSLINYKSGDRDGGALENAIIGRRPIFIDCERIKQLQGNQIRLSRSDGGRQQKSPLEGRSESRTRPDIDGTAPILIFSGHGDPGSVYIYSRNPAGGRLR